MEKTIYFANVYVKRFSIGGKLVDFFHAVESLTQTDGVFPQNVKSPNSDEDTMQVHHYNDLTLVLQRSQAGGKYLNAHGSPEKIKEVEGGLVKKLKDAEWPQDSSDKVQIGNTTAYLLGDLFGNKK